MLIESNILGNIVLNLRIHTETLGSQGDCTLNGAKNIVKEIK